MKLATQLQEVTANFKQQVPAEVFNTIVSAAEALTRSHAFDAALKVGDRMPSFDLPDATGKRVRSGDLLLRGPLLLTFYRGEWCPYCNLALKALQDELPKITASGATLVAISPQTPDHSLSTSEKFALAYPVLSDAGNALAKQLGIVFTLNDELRPLYAGFGIDIPGYNADGSFELPVPATYLIGSNGVILERYLEIDFRQRIEPQTVLDWLGLHSKTISTN